MGRPGDASRFRRALASRFFREPILIALCYIPYEIAHAVAGDRPRVAFENATHLVQIEDSVGIFQEPWLQEAVLSSRFLVHLFNIIYFYGHWPVIIAGGICLFLRRPSIYYAVRNAFLISGALALMFYIFFPVAPPRLSEPGIVDTLAFPVPVALEKSRAVNPYAAFPSLHVGWNILIAIGLFRATRISLIRVLAVALPLAMFVATITTGNHFFIDGIVGAVLALIGIAAVLLARPRMRAGGGSRKSISAGAASPRPGRSRPANHPA
jgi:hypothetical protein